MRQSERLIIANNIRLRRTLARMAQKDLAKKSKVSQSTIAQIESGKKSPSLKTLFILARSLKVQPYQLLLRVKLNFEEQP